MSNIQTISNIAALEALTLTDTTTPVMYVEGYYNSADGGEGAFYDSGVTGITPNGGTIVEDAAGRIWLRETEGAPYNVKWFGAYGNGMTDDSTFVQNTVNAVAARGGGTVYFPPATYLVENTITVSANNVSLVGEGPQVSQLTCPGTFTSDVIQFVGTSSSDPVLHCRMLNIGVIGSVRAGGAQVHLIYAYDTILFNFTLQGGYTGLSIDNSTLCRIEQFNISAALADCINVGGASTQNNVDVFMANGNISGYISSTQKSINNLNIIWVSGMYGQNMDSILGGQNGWLFNPPAGQWVQAVWLTQVLADSTGSNGAGVGFNFQGQGRLADIELTSCWGSSSGNNGIFIGNPNSNGISMNNGVYENNYNSGIVINSGTNIIINAAKIFCNSTSGRGAAAGISVGTNVSGFQITNCVSGKGGIGGSTNNQSWGILVEPGSSDDYIIMCNRCPANISGSVSDGGSGANKKVTDNIS